MKSKYFLPLLVLISIAYLLLRFIGLESKMTFHLDQGIQLSESKQMLDDKKIRLIGPMVISKTYNNRGFFIGPNYYYVLAVLGFVTNWNPLLITLILGIVEFIFIIIFILWLKNQFSASAALFIFSLITFANHFIVHSRFFWNPHFLIPISILLIIFLKKFHDSKKIIYLYLSLVLCGFGVSFHYSALIWGLALLITVIFNFKQIKFRSYLLLPIFFILGNLPFFVFEIRHNFYNTITAFYVFTSSSSSHQLGFYYFSFSLFVFLSYLWVYFYTKTKDSILRYFLILLLIILEVTILFQNDRSIFPLGHPQGWTYPIEKQVVNLILQNSCPSEYNIAATIGGDTRAYDLRFLLSKESCPPLSVDSYPNAKTIFLLAPPTRDPETETVWEISSFKPFKVTEKIIINDDVIFYRLDK